jgi:shikimate kinase
MNLVLIGYRGTGKSAVAALLARKLSMTVVCLDEEIEREAGLSIPEIVKKHGWPWFRDLEAEITRTFSGRDNLILDTGGGVILRDGNVKNLARNGRIFWLKASIETIAARIADSSSRPSLSGSKSFLEEIEEVLAERLPLYKAAADHEIETDRLSVEEVADTIVRTLEQLSAPFTVR